MPYRNRFKHISRIINSIIILSVVQILTIPSAEYHFPTNTSLQVNISFPDSYTNLIPGFPDKSPLARFLFMSNTWSTLTRVAFFDCHNLARRINYVVISMNNIKFVFGLVMPAVSSKVVWFAAHIEVAFWSARVLELVIFLLRTKMVLHAIMFPLSFAITTLALEYLANLNFSLSFVSSSIRRCFWCFSNEKSSELCNNFFLYPFHKGGNFEMIAPTWKDFGMYIFTAFILFMRTCNSCTCARIDLESNILKLKYVYIKNFFVRSFQPWI